MSNARPANPDNQISWDEAIDVAVIGSGFAGLAAAIEAGGTGASVIVFEKMRAVGGNSIISDGGIAAPGTDIQRNLGIEDSADLMYRDMLKAGLGLNHPELVRVVVDNALDAFHWSRDILGVEYMDRIDQFGGHSVPRCYAARNVSGATIIKRQMAKMHELGIPVRLQAYFDSFILDTNGGVIGIQVRENYDYRTPDSGTLRRIKTAKGVVLASGGFGSDIAFRLIQDPRLTKEIDTTNKPFATAEALKEAIGIGAAPVHLSHIQLGPWASPDEKGYGVGPLFADYILFQYGIVLDPTTGSRFVNELADRKTLADAILSVGHPCVGIADRSAVEASGWNIDRCLKKGVVTEFKTLDDFADFYHLPNQGLLEAIQSFNRSFELRKDRCFAKPLIEQASPIETPPYYGIRLWPKVHFTMGGVRINTKGEVMDFEGRSIQRLYAAGEVTGGIHGACRLGSCSITDCLVFGRIAGRSAARH